LIRSVTTYAWPAWELACRRHLPLKISVPAKKGSLHHWKLSKVFTGPWFAHGFHPAICVPLYNKIVQATSRSTKSWELTCSWHRTGQSQTWKYRRPKLRSSQAYDRSSDQAAVVV
jgi:hypothetical protein